MVKKKIKDKDFVGKLGFAGLFGLAILADEIFNEGKMTKVLVQTAKEIMEKAKIDQQPQKSD